MFIDEATDADLNSDNQFIYVYYLYSMFYSLVCMETVWARIEGIVVHSDVLHIE